MLQPHPSQHPCPVPAKTKKSVDEAHATQIQGGPCEHRLQSHPILASICPAYPMSYVLPTP
eukprot:scaffold144694_cov17-Tisochrysis_lutea.AAC.1